MASCRGGGEEELQELAELKKTLKEGERILPPTRRPDGSLRKPLKIRAGYVPQEERAIYKSKGSLWKKEMTSLQECPPGYDPALSVKPKTKSVKRNERKKEKRMQAALEKGKNLLQQESTQTKEDMPNSEVLNHNYASSGLLESQMIKLSVSTDEVQVTSSTDSRDCSIEQDPVLDIEKKIRSLKKKIRLAEAQQQKTAPKDMKPEQLDKIRKLEDWHKELKILEDRKAILVETH